MNLKWWRRDDLKARTDALQAGVDRAYAALVGSAYVGGPTEREAFRQASDALAPLATQHTGRGK